MAEITNSVSDPTFEDDAAQASRGKLSNVLSVAPDLRALRLGGTSPGLAGISDGHRSPGILNTKASARRLNQEQRLGTSLASSARRRASAEVGPSVLARLSARGTPNLSPRMSPKSGQRSQRKDNNQPNEKVGKLQSILSMSKHRSVPQVQIIDESGEVSNDTA